MLSVVGSGGSKCKNIHTGILRGVFGVSLLCPLFSLPLQWTRARHHGQALLRPLCWRSLMDASSHLGEGEQPHPVWALPSLRAHTTGRQQEMGLVRSRGHTARAVAAGVGAVHPPGVSARLCEQMCSESLACSCCGCLTSSSQYNS